ncbi:transposase [Saccharopolyspora lacisalsi]|uniref:Transposase n=1 Tax=Halosaccharopolyspora lacisalsi TaxID=1000566 RepID=A0A839DU83_9PSEU|nr:transposase [Halosaccharopolyspora lacisalsi]MBA8823836.1 transposase [Halosaccharopolyspora lacisalsi]
MRIHRPGTRRRRRSFNETDYAALLSAAHQQLDAPIMLIWDQLNTHVSVAMREVLAARSDWLTVDTLPLHTGLNPVEAVWAHLKSSVANLAAYGVDSLAGILRNRLKRLQYRPTMSRVKEVAQFDSVDACVC